MSLLITRPMLNANYELFSKDNVSSYIILLSKISYAFHRCLRSYLLRS